MLQHIFGNGRDHAFCIHFRMLHKYSHKGRKSALQTGCLTALILQQTRKYQHIPCPFEYNLPSFLNLLLQNMHHNIHNMLPYIQDKLGYIVHMTGCTLYHPSFISSA
jgi:hypothetical protein